jgi:hypothetical protein
MSQNKVKLYKNASRNNVSTTHKPYVPQYQILGVEPEEYKSAPLPSNVTVARSNVDNPRTKQITLRKSPADSYPTFNNHKENIIPNVGNNMDQTWSSIDGDIIDNFEEVEYSQDFIDNNEYISDDAFGTHTLKEQPRISGAVPSYTAPSSADPEDLLAVVQDLDKQSYLLIVNGVCLCSGPIDEIQDQARALVFGEHELCDGNPIPVEDLIILKKINIKMGLFLE